MMGMGTMTFTLSEDGSAVATIDDDIFEGGTWSLSGDSGTITIEDQPMSFRLGEDELIIEWDDVDWAWRHRIIAYRRLPKIPYG